MSGIRVKFTAKMLACDHEASFCIYHNLYETAVNAILYSNREEPMPKPDNECCMFCKFSTPSQNKDLTVITCCRYPPAPVMMLQLNPITHQPENSIQFVFPSLRKQEFWCGEFKRAIEGLNS